MVRYVLSVAVWMMLTGGVAFGAECTFVVNMTGPQEVPGPGDPDGTASGTITLNDVSGLISWNFTYANIAPPTLMHIHTGAAGVSGGVLISLGVATTGGPGTLISSTTHGNLAQVNGVLSNSQGFYVNIHNGPFGNGAVRGQIGSSVNPPTYCIATTVDGSVNGQPVSATGTGSANSDTGIYTIDWTFSSIPAGYSVWGTVITKGGSTGSDVGQAIACAKNILSINGGNYTIHEEGNFPGGDVITADVTVTTSGSTIMLNSTLSGNVNLPDLVGITMPAATWTPGPGPNQFVEAVTKQLIREDGGPSIPVDTVATYTLTGGGELEIDQLRTMGLTVLAADPNVSHPTTATIRYETTISPAASCPAVTTWGLVVLALLLSVTAWVIKFRVRGGHC